MTIRDILTTKSDTLTQAERRLASALMLDYPFVGLMTIQELADRTKVSAASISRFASKLGCNGYADFQRQLIEELRDAQASPLDLHWMPSLPRDGFLAEYLPRTASLISETAEGISEAQFSRICDALANDKRAVFVLGGRISDSIAHLLSRQLMQIRRGVSHISSEHEVWPEYLLRMRPKDTLVLVDFRRYQRTLEQLSEQASRKGASIILITDKWISPIARHAAEVVTVPIQNGTAWDSYCGAVAIFEAIVTALSERNWAATKERISEWDALRITNGDFDKDA